MATTGQISSTATATTSAEAPWDDVDWDSPTYHQTSDGLYAVANFFSLNEQSYVYYVKGFDLSSVPDGATIDGITVRIEARAFISDVEIGLVQLLDASGARAGDNKASTPVALTTTDATYTFGGAADEWGNALTSAWVKDADFGVAIGLTNKRSGLEYGRIDHITVEVHYTFNRIFWIIDDSSGWSDPDGPQIVAGNNASNAAAVASGDVESPTTTTADVVLAAPATGLVASTAYKAAAVWFDGVDYSDVVVSAEFTTTAAGTVISATVGAAVADGALASIVSLGVIAAAAGNAVAAGSDAAVVQSRHIGATAGAAVADGAAAAVVLSTHIAATSGNAVADGASASLIIGSSIGAIPGSAVADGAASSIVLATHVGASAGDAVADGAAATIVTGAAVEGTAGNAVADGATAEIVATASVPATPGNAVAAGATATVSAGLVIAASPGAAVAAGADSAVVEILAVGGIPGDAAADGQAAQIFAPNVINGAAGAAVAAGADAEIAFPTDDDVTAAAVWGYTLSNGLTAAETVVQIHTWLSELHLIHGLRAGSPLTVAQTSRTAGAVEQAIAEVGDAVTVTRQ